MQPLRCLVDVPMARLAEILGEDFCELVVDTPEQRLHPNVIGYDDQKSVDRWLVSALDPWEPGPRQAVAVAELVRWSDDRTEVELTWHGSVSDGSIQDLLARLKSRVGASRVEVISPATEPPADAETGAVPDGATAVTRRRDNGRVTFATLDALVAAISEPLAGPKRHAATAENIAWLAGIARSTLYDRLDAFGLTWPAFRRLLQDKHPQLRRRR